MWCDGFWLQCKGCFCLSERSLKAAVFAPGETRPLFDAIEVTSQIGLPDRSLIGLMVYSFTCIGAALATKVDDVFVQNRRLLLRLTVTGSANRYCKKP